MKLRTPTLLFLIYVTSRSLKHNPNPRGHKILNALYEELYSRYPLPGRRGKARSHYNYE